MYMGKVGTQGDFVCSNADAVIETDGQLLLVEPHETFEPSSDFLGYVQEDSKKAQGPVKYAQTR